MFVLCAFACCVYKVYCVNFVCILCVNYVVYVVVMSVYLCVPGELDQIGAAEPKRKGKEDVDTLATYQMFMLHIYPWRLQVALIVRFSVVDEILNALCIHVTCGSAYAGRHSHVSEMLGA